jgi:hypothetical protein
MNRSLSLLGIALTALSLAASPARALSSQDVALTVGHGSTLENDALEAHQYRLPEARVAGQESIRQQVTVWEVTAGAWNGQSLKGLTLVLVRSSSDSDQSQVTTNCYVSHEATFAQRQALLSAYAASQSISSNDVLTWRVEPAVIRFEWAGQTMVVHLGLVA